MAGDKTKRQVSAAPIGDKLRFPNGKYQTPSFMEVRVKGPEGESIQRVEHMPDVHPEMRGKPATIHIE